jgi:hypothetical protein
MSQNKSHTPVNKPAGVKQDEVKVRALKDCFIRQLRFPGEVFTAKKTEVCDADGKLLKHFEYAGEKVKSKRIEPEAQTNPYGEPPVIRESKQES